MPTVSTWIVLNKYSVPLSLVYFNMGFSPERKISQICDAIRMILKKYWVIFFKFYLLYFWYISAKTNFLYGNIMGDLDFSKIVDHRIIK